MKSEQAVVDGAQQGLLAVTVTQTDANAYKHSNRIGMSACYMQRSSSGQPVHSRTHSTAVHVFIRYSNSCTSAGRVQCNVGCDTYSNAVPVMDDASRCA